MSRYSVLWIFWATWATSTGWILSALHELNGWGYSVAGVLGLGALFWWLRQPSQPLRLRRSPGQVVRGFTRGLRRRPFQALFALLCLLIFLGGACYIPWSFDATTYRLPRVLYWWAHNGWYWTHTADNRMDYSSVGFEWQMLPVMLLTASDRFLFLLNWIPFLFLPSLLLPFLRSFRVQRPLACILMWVIPSGYCFALQAGGIENDGYTVFYLLAAFVFLDAYQRHSRRFDLVISLLAAALLNGAKFSNVFLLLPYAVLLGSVLYERRRDYAIVLAAALPCLLVSFVPLTTLCYLNTGDISGDPQNLLGLKAQHHVQTLSANLAFIAEDSAQPPFVAGFKPKLDQLAGWFNATPLSRWLERGHPNYHGLAFGEFVYEGGAGLGLGVTVMMVVISVLHFPCLLARRAPYPEKRLLGAALAGWGAFFICLSMISSDSMARICAPYYPLLIATFPWMACRGRWDRSWLPKAAAGLALVSSILLVLVAPVRPVVPMLRLLRHFADDKPSGWAATTLDKYEFWAGLRDNLADVRRALPPDGEPIGYLGAYRETSYGLWKPIGSRKIFELSQPDPRVQPPGQDIHFAVVTEAGIRKKFGMSLADWLQRYQVETKQVFLLNMALTAKSKPNLATWMLVTWK